MNQEYTTPTDMANFEYCPRYYYLNKIHPHSGKTTAPTVIGKFEHAIFEYR